jgi:hypothetical protein
MSAPKTVVKLSKNGVEYTSSVDKCQYYIFELSRRALMDVGRYVTRVFADSYYTIFKKNSNKARRAIRYKVFSSKNTKYPRVQIGLKNTQVGFYSMFQEFGSSKTKKYGLLTKSVENNIAKIVEIESQYLSSLEDEAKALSLVESENDYEGGGDDE